MLSKSLIQLSVEGWSCVPSLLLIWGQTMGEVMKIMVNSLMFKLVLEKAEEPEIKLPTSTGSSKSRKVPEKYLLLLY